MRLRVASALTLSPACSLAGTLGLSKLTAFWDDNGISIDGEVVAKTPVTARLARRAIKMAVPA